MIAIGSTSGFSRNRMRPPLGPKSSLRMPSGVAISFRLATANSCLGAVRQQAEAVDHLHLQVAQVARRCGALAMRLYSVRRACTSRQVVVGDQRRQVQFDLGLVLGAEVEVGHLAAT